VLDQVVTLAPVVAAVLVVLVVMVILETVEMVELVFNFQQHSVIQNLNLDQMGVE
jgi:hypothetical protein